MSNPYPKKYKIICLDERDISILVEYVYQMTRLDLEAYDATRLDSIIRAQIQMRKNEFTKKDVFEFIRSQD